MIQEIITYAILILTFTYFSYKVVVFFIDNSKKDKNGFCSSCSKSGCEGCPFAGNTFSVKYYKKTK